MISLVDDALPEHVALIVRAVDCQLLKELLHGGVCLRGIGHLLEPLWLAHRERVESMLVTDS